MGEQLFALDVFAIDRVGRRERHPRDGGRGTCDLGVLARVDVVRVGKSLAASNAESGIRVAGLHDDCREPVSDLGVVSNFVLAHGSHSVFTAVVVVHRDRGVLFALR